MQYYSLLHELLLCSTPLLRLHSDSLHSAHECLSLLPDLPLLGSDAVTLTLQGWQVLGVNAVQAVSLLGAHAFNRGQLANDCKAGVTAAAGAGAYLS